MDRDYSLKTATEIAIKSLSSHENFEDTYLEYKATLGDIASHLVAYAAVKKTKGSLEDAVASYLKSGFDVLTKLASSNKAYKADKDFADRGIEGRVGANWIINGHRISHFHDTWLISRSVRGVHKTLPLTHNENDKIKSYLQFKLKKKGLPDSLIEQVELTSSTTKWTDRSSTWTNIKVPMGDPRVNMKISYEDADHISFEFIKNSLTHFAMNVESCWEHRLLIEDLLDICEKDVTYRIFDLEYISIRNRSRLPNVKYASFKNSSVYNVISRKGMGKPDGIVIHLEVAGLSESLLEYRHKVVMTSDASRKSNITTNFDSIFEGHSKRVKALRKLGGPVVEQIGLSFMEAAGYDQDRFREAVEKTNMTVFDVSLSKGKMASGKFKVSCGKITASIRLNDEIQWAYNHLRIRRKIPETLVCSLEGRLVTDVVDHPVLVGKKITTAKMNNGQLEIGIEPVWKPYHECN